MDKDSKIGECALCKRETNLTFHHLIPRKLHKRPFFKRTYSKESLRKGIDICPLCHSGIHRIHDEAYLGKNLYTLELLQKDPSTLKHYTWVAKQKLKH